MRVAIYARVSTDKQELQQQIDSCKRFCEYKQFDVADIYSDTGSGKAFFIRPNWMELLGKLKRLEYQGLVVFRFDRVGRNMVECITFYEEMERIGVQIFSINENFDTSNAIGRAIRDFIIRLAQLERENISEATKQRLQSARDAGKKLGRPTISTYKRNRIQEMRGEGKSLRFIAGELGVSLGVVHKTLLQLAEEEKASKQDVHILPINEQVKT